MACLKKFFIKDRGSWTPTATGFIGNAPDENSKRYIIIDFENESRMRNVSSTSSTKEKKILQNHELIKSKLAQNANGTSHSPSKRPAPKHPKEDPRYVSEIQSQNSSVNVSHPNTNLNGASNKKIGTLTVQSPTYLEELKEKQNVLRVRKAKPGCETDKNLSNYEELKFCGESILDLAKSQHLKKNPMNLESIPKVKLHKSHKQLTDQNTKKHPIADKNSTLRSTNSGENRKLSYTERDSGVHIEENSFQLNGDTEIEKDDHNNTGDDLNPPTHLKGRKEGLIFTRPKLSKEKEKVIKVFQKDDSARELIRNAIEANDFLNNYMDEDRKTLVIDAMEPATYEKDSFIIRQDEEGSEIYVSDEGIFDVIKNNEIINTFGAGNLFGELAILYNARRFASIKVSSKSKVWKIERSKFRTIMVISGSKEREENLNFLRSVPLLKDLPEDVLLRIVDLLKRVFFPTNTCIVRQGNIGNDFFIIRGNSVTIKKSTAGGDERVVDRRYRGEYFGELALLNEDRRQASVYADEPGTECLKLDRASFISYLGTLPELKEKPIERIVATEERRSSTIRNAFDHIQLCDLDRVATLGVGGFGRVDLVSYKGTQTFALKILNKIDIIKEEQIDHVYSEKVVMQMCHSPFIVELYATFRDNKCVYFLMEACLGGDVWTIMNQRQYFDEKTARFIVGCVVEAFEFLHIRNIIYRDLKPENLMLTPDGYCKLVDFGFAKRMMTNCKTNTFAGTPEYVAPEIILDRGHDRAVDYWELGILIHELLSGRPPFRGKDQMKIYQQILGGIEVIKMSTRIPKYAQNLIKNLCKQMPAERLGYQKRGIADIKKHSWFDGFDWSKLQNKTLPAPILRPTQNNTDLRYFTLNNDTFDTPPDEMSGWDNNF